jgi:hypothetical protein
VGQNHSDLKNFEVFGSIGNLSYSSVNKVESKCAQLIINAIGWLVGWSKVHFKVLNCSHKLVVTTKLWYSNTRTRVLTLVADSDLNMLVSRGETNADPRGQCTTDFPRY